MQTIGRYEIVDRMGSGGFATVYRARDPQLDSEVAIKVLAENWADNPEFKDRFMREAQLLRRIDSDHVVTVHDVGVTASGQPYFVMALADRGTLEDRLADRPPPTGHDAVAIAERLADCVGTIHSYDLIHRDIKPSNLLIAAVRRTGRQATVAGILAADERMLLGDFGLAKDTALTGTGLTIAAGTGGYAAPEQMSPTGVPDLRTDVYAATAVMYRVASGTRPPPFDLASQIVPFVDDDWWMKGELGAFFRRGMAFHQGGRHRDLQEWFEDFRRAVLNLAGSGPGLTRPATPGDHHGGSTGWDPPPVSEAGTAHWARPDSGPTSGGRVISGPSQESPGSTGHHPLSQPAVARDGTASWAGGQGSPAAHFSAAPGAPSGLGQRPAPQGYDPGQQSVPYHPGPQQSVPYRQGQPQAYQTPTRSGSGGSRLTTFVVLPIIVLAAAGAAWYFLSRGAEPAIIGDDQVLAGRETTFTAELEGADEFRWTNFDGTTAPGPTFAVTGVLPGTITLEVTALAGGEELGTATRTVEVVESPEGPTITGPGEAKVGELVQYTYAETDTLTEPRWVYPDGQEEPGSIFQLTPTAPGSYTIVLKVVDSDGDVIGAKKEVQLVE